MVTTLAMTYPKHKLRKWLLPLNEHTEIEILILSISNNKSSSSGVFETPVCPTIAALHYMYSTFELQRASMCTSFVGLIQQSM